MSTSECLQAIACAQSHQEASITAKGPERCTTPVQTNGGRASRRRGARERNCPCAPLQRHAAFNFPGTKPPTRHTRRAFCLSCHPRLVLRPLLLPIPPINSFYTLLLIFLRSRVAFGLKQRQPPPSPPSPSTPNETPRLDTSFSPHKDA